jgi:serine/threonine-protein kinase RsbW
MLVRMELALPRDARYVGLMRSVAACIMADLGTPEEAREDVQLAVTEACANAVRHAVGSAEYTVRLAVGQDSCEVEIVDLGPGFAPPADDAELALDSESGRGLTLIRALVDDLQFDRDGGDNRIRLVKRWPALGNPEQGSEGVPSDLRGSQDAHRG